MWAAFGIGDGGGGHVDAEIRMQRGKDFRKGDGTTVCLAARRSVEPMT